MSLLPFSRKFLPNRLHRQPPVPVAPMASASVEAPSSPAVSMHFEVDRFVFLLGFVNLRGRLINATLPVTRIDFCVLGRVMARVAPEPDNSFEISAIIGDREMKMEAPSLVVFHADSSVVVIEHPARFAYFDDNGMRLYGEFLNTLKTLPPGEILEIGSRARSGNVHKTDFPPTWNYTGFDVMAGENVDVVGDAHRLSHVLPHQKFNAVVGFSVFEHLAMPWKVAIEMNRVMALGGLGFIFTHQTFPLHDEPWDYFRFSRDSWSALFNEQTGFRIVHTGYAEPVFVVGKFWNAGVDHRLAPGQTVSSVLIEKIGETELTWPVSLRDVTPTNYPA